MKATTTQVNKRIIIKERKTEGILSYDIDNNYPARVKDIVKASGMASACVKLYGKFIFGRGFQDIEFAKTVINRHGLTPDVLLRKLREDFKHYSGFCIHINYNALYEICEVNFQPLSQVRITAKENKKFPNMYAVYTDWEERHIKKEQIVHIDRFNPNPEIIQQQVDREGGWDKYRGQIYYHSNNHDSYPEAIFDAELESMQTDDQSKLYKFRNVTTNFMASHAIIIDPIESAGEEDDVDLGSEKNTLVADLETYQGAENAQKLIVIEKDSPEQNFKIEKIDQQSQDNIFEYTETSTRNNIRQIFLIPPVLLMELAGRIAGTSDELIDATKSYNSTTEDERLEIEEVFRKIFCYFEYDINPEKNFSILPKSYVEKDDAIKKKNIAELIVDNRYTDEQKVKMLVKLYDVDEADARLLVKPSDLSEETVASTLSPQQLAQMINVISNEHLTSIQKRGALKAIYNLSDDKINLIIPQDVTID